MTDRPTFIIIRETFWDSWLSDLGSAGVVVAMIWLGVWVESPAMQWAGAIIGMLAILGRAASINRRQMTLDEARAYLDSLTAPASSDGGE